MVLSFLRMPKTRCVFWHDDRNDAVERPLQLTIPLARVLMLTPMRLLLCKGEPEPRVQ